MKRFFGAFLIICMVLTSMSVGVSADYALSGEDHVFTFTDSEVGKYYNIGYWYLSNGAEGSEPVKLGEFSYDTVNMGMNFKKIDLDANSLTNPGVASTFSIRGDVAYAYAEGAIAYAQTAGDSEMINNSDMNSVLIPSEVDTDGAYVAKTGKVVKYTMYAYSALQDGEPLSVDYTVVADSGNIPHDLDHDNMAVPASKLYSADGIPHKIDFVIYYPGTSTEVFYNKFKATGAYYEIHIDGLFYSGGKLITSTHTLYKLTTKETRYSWIAPQINISSDGENEVKWKDTEMYICTNPISTRKRTPITTEGGEFLTFHSYSDIDNQLFQNIDFGKFTTARALRENIVNGVDSDLASELEALYTNWDSGDRVLAVDESIYNAPASIWGENTTSSVSLVKKSDGTVYEAGDDVTGTFDDYLISVNGVYTKVAEIEKPVVNSYDIDTKTATVNVSTLPAGTESLRIIVAAYNASKALEKVSVSDEYTLTSNITYEIKDTTFPNSGDYKYKMFVFESLSNIKPLLNVIEK